MRTLHKKETSLFRASVPVPSGTLVYYLTSKITNPNQDLHKKDTSLFRASVSRPFWYFVY